MEELDLPIDIHYNKLLDWLIDRRHCELKWVTHVRQIRESVSHCLQQLPGENEEIARIRGKEPLNYFHYQQIFEILKHTDGDSKTLFGKYTSPRVQSWAEVLKLYERKSVYLAEGAQQLARNVNYEIPALKQSLAKCQQVQWESEKRQEEARNNAAALREKFLSSCREMGVEGENVRDELLRLVSALPHTYDTTVSALPRLMPAIVFYQSFIHYCTGRAPVEAHLLPMLSYIMKNGNVTLHQWKYGSAPEPPAESPEQQPEEREEEEGTGSDEDAVQIDWGDLSHSDSTDLATGQQSGMELEGGGMETIEWDGLETLDVSEIMIEESGEGGGEKEEEEGGERMGETAVVEDGESGASLSAGSDMDSLLSSTKTRNLFLDDLMELKEFLSQRICELSTETSGVLMGQFGSDSEVLRHQTGESVGEMLSHVTSVLDILTNSRTRHLLLIKNSPRYLERLATSLLSYNQLSHRATAQAEAMASRREEAIETAVSLQPKLAAMIAHTRELQKQVEADISRRYNNRVVNIMGEINMI